MPRYVYDPETLEITDTSKRLDLLRVYARVPYHENGVHITTLLNAEEDAKKKQQEAPSEHPQG